jgi:hypothetical protein
MPLLDEGPPATAADFDRPPPPRPPVRLGEELPIFCERCGYSLHGLPQARCERCTVLHYACPECNHHQPINTLRPAVQRMLARLRAAALVLWVLFLLNFFGWLLMAWGAMGVEWSYQLGHVRGGGGRSPFVEQQVSVEAFIAFGLFGFVFGIVGRMFLLRWGRSVLVGAALAGLVCTAVMVGAYLQWLDISWRTRDVPPPVQTDMLLLAAWAGGFVVLGAGIVWPVWLSLVYLFLPKKTAKALLDWQRALSGRPPANEASLARD